LGVNVELPATVSGPVQTMFSLVNESGQSLTGGKKTLPQPPAGQPYLYTFALPAPDGQYRLRITAADASGRVGSAEQRIDASLRRAGRWLVSDLFTGWSAADGVHRFLALDRLPDGAVMLHASLELYPDTPAPAPELAVRFSLAPVDARTPGV